MWRHAFVGHAGAKELYQIMQNSYAVPESPPASELGSSETTQIAEFWKKNQDLWFLLAQATKGAAAMLVMRFEEPRPDGRGAWLELERVYGGRAEDEKAAQLRLRRGGSRASQLVVYSRCSFRWNSSGLTSRRSAKSKVSQQSERPC